MAQTKLSPDQITPSGSDSHVQYNNGGEFGGEADFVWEDVTKTLLIGGTNWYTALSALTGGIHVSKDGGGAFTNVITGHSWVDGVDDFTGVPSLGADRAGGSRATPTAILDNMGLVRLNGGGYDGTTLSGTRAQVLLRAAGNWSGTSHPTKIELWTTPIGSVTRRKVFTVGDDGNVDILTGKTYNVNGSPHTHTTADITDLAAGTWTPTATAGANVGAVVSALCHYVRIGNEVTFHGSLQVDTTAVGAFTCYLTLPIASNFNAATDASGNGTNPGASASSIISIREDQTNDRLQLDGYAQVNTNLFYRIVGGYIIK